MCNHVKHVCMCWLVLSLLFPIHPFTTDKLLTPNNLYIRYQCSLIHDQYMNDYFGTSPKGKSYPVSFGTHTQGQDQPHTPTSKCLPRGL